MTPLIKRSKLAKRMKALEKELSAVDSELKTLSKGAAKAEGGSPMTEPASVKAVFKNRGSLNAQRPEASDKIEQDVKRIGKQIRDKRFADYLSTSFQASRPLRHERRIQRNKAILMAVLAALALFWVVYRFFM